jgi:phosphoenolpyruvate---glycerone phosphotransferase subunit DhaL
MLRMEGKADMLNGTETRAWVLRYCAKVRQDADELTELDRRAGDGDFGWNISSALARAGAVLEAAAARKPGEVFGAVSDGFLSAGGTSGPLFGLWFGELARPESDVLTLAELRGALGAGTSAVMRLGKAEVGHMTMVDAMVPATEALESVNPNITLREALADAATAAFMGAESTRSMIANRGRASYVGEHARGVIDPGALAVAWFFAAACSSEDES